MSWKSTAKEALKEAKAVIAEIRSWPVESTPAPASLTQFSLDAWAHRMRNVETFPEISDDEILELLQGLARLTEDERKLWDMMEVEDATIIRAARVGPDGEVRQSWREIAGLFHDRLGRHWEPPSNQIWGRSLCIVAAFMLGEDGLTKPWN